MAGSQSFFGFGGFWVKAGGGGGGFFGAGPEGYPPFRSVPPHRRSLPPDCLAIAAQLLLAGLVPEFKVSNFRPADKQADAERLHTS